MSKNETAHIFPSRPEGTVRPPASKSACHRAIICASLAQGTSRLCGLSFSADIQATISCMQSLGAKIAIDGHTATIQGADPAALSHPVQLDANESGSTLRFLIPAAACSNQLITFSGKPSLLARPMGVYADLFLSQNLRFDQSAKAITFQGPLQGGLFTLPGNVSSQFISGLLMAAPVMPNSQGSEIAVLPPYESRSYTDMTVQMMERFGVQIERPSQNAYLIAPGQTYHPADLTIEADCSQMAFFAVLAALNAPLEITSVNFDTLQGDRVIFDLLEKAGAQIRRVQAQEQAADSITEKTAEPADSSQTANTANTAEADTVQETAVCENQEGSVIVSPKNRWPLTVDLSDCPDLGPILFVLAAYLPGTSHFTNAGRLRIKECDRLEAMESELKKWGVAISTTGDTVTITGKKEYAEDHLVEIDGHNDHRIVMAMTIFGLCASSPCVIQGAQAITKSYPSFFRDIQQIKGKVVLS